MFLFYHLTYLVQLDLVKLSRPKYQQKLNKIIKISQEGVILIKNLYLSKQYGAQRLSSELPDKGWKVVASLATRRVQLSCNQAAVDRWVGSSGGPRAQSGRQAKKASISS